MNIRRTLFCAALSVFFAAGFFSKAFAQSVSRMDRYTASTFQATWTDISATADTFEYNKGDLGWGTIAMPFDFPYDDSIITAGSKIRIGASGVISLASDTTPNGPALNSASYPGLVCIFSSFAVAGKGNGGANYDYYQVDSSAPYRVLTVQYHFAHLPGTGSGGGHGGAGGNSAMMQVKFYETTGVIEFIYQLHNSLFEKYNPGIDTVMFGGVGLNGLSTPSFLADVYETHLIATPANDLRWTPGTPGEDSISVSQNFAPNTCSPGLDTATITVMNTGTVATSYQASIAGADSSDFTLLSPATSPTVSAGGVATFQVGFKVTTDTEKTVNFILNGGPGGAVALYAGGGAAMIAGLGDAPTTAIGQTSAAFPVVVSNTGACPWISGIPTVNSQFSYVSGAGTIEGGASAPLMFTYTPSVQSDTTYFLTFPNAAGDVSSVNVSIITATAGVNSVSATSGFILEQNYPNPCSGKTECEIMLPVAAMVHLTIIDAQGQVVQTLLNQHYDAGTFVVTMNTGELSSGVYYYQMTAGGVTLTRQMAIIK